MSMLIHFLSFLNQEKTFRPFYLFLLFSYYSPWQYVQFNIFHFLIIFSSSCSRRFFFITFIVHVFRIYLHFDCYYVFYSLCSLSVFILCIHIIPNNDYKHLKSLILILRDTDNESSCHLLESSFGITNFTQHSLFESNIIQKI